jgi:hypothetical protein
LRLLGSAHSPGAEAEPGLHPAGSAIHATIFALVLVPNTLWNWQNMQRFNTANAARVTGPLPASRR